MDGEWIFQRSELLLGKEKVERLSRKNVLVIGVGGVGAFAAEFIARAGVGNMTIVDGDCVETTNRNRQLLALESTMQQPKVKVMRQRLIDINPDIKVNAIEKFIAPEEVSELVNEGFDFVVDAIDSVPTKAALIAECFAHQIPMVSSMGAAGKIDPTMITIAKLSKTHHCGLAKALRTRLKKIPVFPDVTTVFSAEEPFSDHYTRDGKPGTISYLPAMFGAYCAAVTLRHLMEN